MMAIAVHHGLVPTLRTSGSNGSFRQPPALHPPSPRAPRRPLPTHYAAPHAHAAAATDTAWRAGKRVGKLGTQASTAATAVAAGPFSLFPPSPTPAVWLAPRRSALHRRGTHSTNRETGVSRVRGERIRASASTVSFWWRRVGGRRPGGRRSCRRRACNFPFTIFSFSRSRPASSTVALSAVRPAAEDAVGAPQRSGDSRPGQKKVYRRRPRGRGNDSCGGRGGEDGGDTPGEAGRPEHPSLTPFP